MTIYRMTTKYVTDWLVVQPSEQSFLWMMGLLDGFDVDKPIYWYNEKRETPSGGEVKIQIRTELIDGSHHMEVQIWRWAPVKHHRPDDVLAGFIKAVSEFADGYTSGYVGEREGATYYSIDVIY